MSSEVLNLLNGIIGQIIIVRKIHIRTFIELLAPRPSHRNTSRVCEIDVRDRWFWAIPVITGVNEMRQHIP